MITDKTPILGICLGVQLFTSHSEEGDVDGLNWINAKTIRFGFSSEQKRLKVPHMGWNSISVNKQSPLVDGIPNDELFYFVHSYYIKCEEQSDILTSTNYGFEYTSAIERDNIYGTQFHPEKSHDAGFQMIKNFINI